MHNDLQVLEPKRAVNVDLLVEIDDLALVLVLAPMGLLLVVLLVVGEVAGDALHAAMLGLMESAHGLY